MSSWNDMMSLLSRLGVGPGPTPPSPTPPGVPQGVPLQGTPGLSPVQRGPTTQISMPNGGIAVVPLQWSINGITQTVDPEQARAWGQQLGINFPTFANRRDADIYQDRTQGNPIAGRHGNLDLEPPMPQQIPNSPVPAPQPQPIPNSPPQVPWQNIQYLGQGLPGRRGPSQ